MESDIKLSQDKPKPGVSDLNLLESGIDLAAPHQPAEAKHSDVGSKVSQFEDLDMTLDHDLTLEESSDRRWFRQVGCERRFGG